MSADIEKQKAEKFIQFICYHLYFVFWYHLGFSLCKVQPRSKT